MSFYNNSWLITCGFICVYPIIGYFVIGAIVRRVTKGDWSQIRFPWRKEQ